MGKLGCYLEVPRKEGVVGVGKGRGEKQTDMAGYGSYSPSLDFVSIPVPHPNFNIPGVDFSCREITNPVSIWQKSSMCELLAMSTDCRKIHSKDISRKKDWLYPEEPGQHVLPQRCVLETVCFFVRLFVFNFLHCGSKHKATRYMPIFSFFYFCFLVFFLRTC